LSYHYLPAVLKTGLEKTIRHLALPVPQMSEPSEALRERLTDNENRQRGQFG
jgi:hypothetical protein